MIGLEIDVGGGNEIDMEVEEGEACSYRNDDESNIDPDAFTYIDEKLQNVLGHFKKDFEGGVFTENLGAKYGGYGSFLIQRSPVQSYSRSPANGQNNQSHKSPTCLSTEGGNNSSLAQSNGHRSKKHEPASIHSASSEAYKAPSRHSLARQVSPAPKYSSEESTAEAEVVDNSANINEPRTLKIRIKVSSDNLSAKQNAAIYNGLGLVSPSSSFDDSPTGNERLSQGFHDPGDESPNQIIQIMTSLPIYGGHLLSPLPEALARLTEKLLQNNTVESASRHNWDISVLGCNGTAAKSLPVEDRMKSEGKNHLPPKRKKDSERALNDANLILKNQAVFDTEACEEMVSEALKLPLLSDFHGTLGKRRGTSKKKSNALSNALRHEPLMPISRCDGDWNENQNGDENLAVEVAHEEKVDLQNDIPRYQKKGGRRGQPANSSTNNDANDFVSMSRKGSLTGPNDSQRKKNGKESTSIEQEGVKLPYGGDQLSLSDKKKLKGSHATQISKGSIKNVVSGQKDSYITDTHSSKKEIKSFPEKKDLNKVRDKYTDFFGDMIEDGDGLMDSPTEPSIDKTKIYQVSEKGLNSYESNSRERASKGDHERLMPKFQTKRVSDFAPPSHHVPPIGEPAPAGAPVEDWVQCDKCLKWRLLPFGTKGDSLPDKWLCIMLNWLPGMNNCSITEEETTKAVARLNQPQNVNGVAGILSEGNPGTAANGMHPEQSHQDIFPVSGKRHGLKEVPHSKHSLNKKSLIVAAGSQLENEPHFPHLRNSTDPVLETSQHKKKSKKKHLDKYSDGDQSKNSKRDGHRERYQDHARASKKIKVEEEVYINEKLIHNSNNDLLISGSQKYQPANRECSSRSSKGHTEDSLQNSIKKSKFQAQASPHADCMDARNDDDLNGVVKKRKVKSSLSDFSPCSLTGKIFDETDETGQKKARISMPQKKTSGSSRGNSRTDKKRKGTKDHRLGKDADDHRSLKRELGAAATSSSSKVSGSQRSKSILREVKNSPVESVSSSPFRTLDLDTYSSGVKNAMEKDSFQNCGILTKGNPIRFADAKADSGGERSGAMGKDLCGNNINQSVHDLKDGIEGFFVGDEVQIKNSADKADLLDHCNVNGVLLKQSAKDSSRSKSKDKNKILKSESDTYDDLQDDAHAIEGKTTDIKMNFQHKSGCVADSIEIDFGGKKRLSANILDEQSKKDSKLKSVGQEAPVAKEDASLEMGSVAKKKANTDYGEKRFDQDKDEEMDLHRGIEKETNKNELSNCISRPYQRSGADASGVNVRDSGKGSKEQMSSKKFAMQNRIHSSSSKHQLSNVHKVKIGDAPSPVRRDSYNQSASSALKEAKDLKHLADRKKNSGSAESTGLYFEAALKFLHGACLLESSGSENSKRGDVIQSMQVYSSTAMLCEFCAHEYEKSKDLACAALAYKCMEVAYLRVIYSSHPAASRDRHELQTSLQMVPPGESPSSSASDIDNASNLATVEKAAQAREGNSPQPGGNHVIPASNRPNFVRMLKYMQDVNSAMEASRKTQGAFAAAQAAMQQARSKEGIAFVKRVVNFNFHDVDGLLSLVRVAVEAIKQ